MTAFNNPVWTAEGITDAKLNERLRDNMNHLKAPPTDYYNYAYAGSTYETTSSTTFVQIDANLALSLTTYGGDVLLIFNAAGSNAIFDFVIDGSRVGGNEGLFIAPTLASFGGNTQMVWLAQNLVAGSHTFDVYWKVASGTGSLFQYIPPSIFAREFS